MIYDTQGGLGLSNSNTGYLGDGYAQAGEIGVTICSIALTYIVDYISNHSVSGFILLMEYVKMSTKRETNPDNGYVVSERI